MSDFVVVVTAAYDATGKLIHAANVVTNGASMPYPAHGLPVRVGDRIGWYTQMQVGTQRRPLPYNVIFDSAAFFGVSSLAVPQGGASDSLFVKTLQGKTKFSVSIPGIGVILDPEIQTGTDGTFQGQLVADYTVIWYIDTNELKYQVGGNSPQNFPMPPVARNKAIAFTAISAMIQPTIVIDFPLSENLQNNWASPFCSGESEFPPAGTPATASVGPLAVIDNLDASGTIFTFYARTADSSTHSVNQQITLA